MTGLALALILSLLPAPPVTSTALASPIAYSGTIPCADCPGIKMTLNLLTDGTFLLRMEYLERKTVFVDLGRWAIREGKLTLLGSGESPDYFRVLNAETIRKLDGTGKEIPTPLNFDLKREAPFKLIEDRARLSGSFVYMADAASITPCTTGQRLPVAMEGEYRTLEKEYTEKRPAPGEPLLVTVEGHLADRPKVDGAGTQRTFVVDRFEKASPVEACPPLKEFAPKSSSRTPDGPNWILVSLKGESVPSGEGKGKPPSLRFDGGSRRVAGFTGCNRLSGKYAIKGDVLTLSHVATTKKACKGESSLEARFLAVLPDVTGWSISENRLTLLARKEAVAEFVEKDE